MEPFVSPREPLTALNKLGIPDAAAVVRSLLEHFDMFRVVYTSSIRVAFRFAYLEHLMRISTSQQEFNQFTYSSSASLQCKLFQAARMRVISNARSFKFLEDVVFEDDFTSMEEPNYRGVKVKIVPFMEQSVFPQSIDARAPIFYVLARKQFNLILYPELVTYLDGYNPCSGYERQPLVTESILTKAQHELYSEFRQHHNEYTIVPKISLSLNDRQQTKDLLANVRSKIQSRATTQAAEKTTEAETLDHEERSQLQEQRMVIRKSYVESAQRTRSCCSNDICQLF